MTVSTHVLDTTAGRPASGVQVRLERRHGDAWHAAGEGTTNADGRVPSLAGSSTLAPGEYRVIFDVADYFRIRNIDAFYPRVTVEFIVREPAAHHHVPLLLSPFGYSTYRGS